MPDSVTKDPVSEVQYPPSILEDVNKLVQRVQTFTGATGAAIALREGAEMVCRATRGSNAPDVGMILSLDGTFTGLAVTGMKAVRCDDTENDSRVDPEISRALRIKSMAVVPVLSGMKVTGVIAVFSGIGGAFSDTHMAVLKTMADGLGAVIQRWLEGHVTSSTATYTPPPTAPRVEASRPAAPPQPRMEPTPAPRVEEPKSAPVSKPAAATATATAPAFEKAPETKQPKKQESQGKWKPVPVAPKQDEEAVPVEKPVAKAEPKPQPRVEPMSAPIFTAESTSANEGGKNPVVIGGIAAVVLFAAIGGYFMFGHSSAKPAASSAPAASKPAPATTTPAPATTPTASTAAPAQTTAPAGKPDAAKTAADKTPKPSQVADTTRTIAAPLVVTHAPAASNQQQAADVAPPSISFGGSAAGPALDVPMTTSAPKLSAPAPANAVVVPSRLLQRVNPNYPAAAKQYRVEGAVTLSATIGSDGHVRDAKIISGPPMLREAAASAVKQWKYAPSTVNGRPVESTVQVVLQFRMPS